MRKSSRDPPSPLPGSQRFAGTAKVTSTRQTRSGLGGKPPLNVELTAAARTSQASAALRRSPRRLRKKSSMPAPPVPLRPKRSVARQLFTPKEETSQSPGPQQTSQAEESLARIAPCDKEKTLRIVPSMQDTETPSTRQAGNRNMRSGSVAVEDMKLSSEQLPPLGPLGDLKNIKDTPVLKGVKRKGKETGNKNPGNIRRKTNPAGHIAASNPRAADPSQSVSEATPYLDKLHAEMEEMRKFRSRRDKNPVGFTWTPDVFLPSGQQTSSSITTKMSFPPPPLPNHLPSGKRAPTVGESAQL